LLLAALSEAAPWFCPVLPGVIWHPDIQSCIPIFPAKSVQPMTKADLITFKTYDATVDKALVNYFGQKGWGWCINGEGSGAHDNTCNYNGWSANLALGEQKNTIKKKKIGATVGEFEITNCNTEQVQFDHNFSIEIGTSASAELSKTVGVSATASVGVSFGVVEAGLETSVSMEASYGSSTEYSDTKTQSIALSTPIPSGATVKIEFMGTQYEGDIDFEVPVRVEGVMGVKLGHGNYQPIPLVYVIPLDQRTQTMKGSMKISAASTDGTYLIRPPTYGKCASLSANNNPYSRSGGPSNNINIKKL